MDISHPRSGCHSQAVPTICVHGHSMLVAARMAVCTMFSRRHLGWFCGCRAPPATMRASWCAAICWPPSEALRLSVQQTTYLSGKKSLQNSRSGKKPSIPQPLTLLSFQCPAILAGLSVKGKNGNVVNPGTLHGQRHQTFSPRIPGSSLSEI